MSAPEDDEIEDDAPSVALRQRPPSPRRLSRKVLMGGAIAVSAIAALALAAGLSTRPHGVGESQTTAQAALGPPETVSQAPAQYDALTFGADQSAAPDTDALSPPASPLWRESEPAPASAAPRATATPSAPPQAAGFLVANDARSDTGHANAGAEAGDDGRLASVLRPPSSPFVIQAGDTISAALITGLNSDLPGRVIAQVTSPVFDSMRGRYLLVPQGSRLIGAYADAPAYGAARIMVVWERLILPNGWSIDLKQMAASDASGAAGIHDQVDNHFDRLGAAVGLSAIISVIAGNAEDRQHDGVSSTSQTLGDAAAQQAAQTGARIVERELTVHPSLRVRPGARVRVLVTRDIQLRPYAPAPP